MYSLSSILFARGGTVILLELSTHRHLTWGRSRILDCLIVPSGFSRLEGKTGIRRSLLIQHLGIPKVER